MAITKSFIEHTMLKAQDLNELVTQANGYVHEVDAKKPDTVDISNYISEGDELPLGCYYVYYGNPTHTLAGRYTYTDTYFIAICISHWEHAHTLAIYTKNAQNKYIYYETFRTDQASTAMERYIASLFSEPPVTYEQDGLMTHQDKQLFDDMLTEVFPLTASFYQSNVDIIPSINAYINKNTGEVVSNNDFLVTDFIDIANCDRISFYAPAYKNIPIVAFYDNSKTYIEESYIAFKESQNVDIEIKCPCNAKYVKISCITSSFAESCGLTPITNSIKLYYLGLKSTNNDIEPIKDVSIPANLPGYLKGNDIVSYGNGVHSEMIGIPQSTKMYYTGIYFGDCTPIVFYLNDGTIETPTLGRSSTQLTELEITIPSNAVAFKFSGVSSSGSPITVSIRLRGSLPCDVDALKTTVQAHAQTIEENTEAIEELDEEVNGYSKQISLPYSGFLGSDGTYTANGWFNTSDFIEIGDAEVIDYTGYAHKSTSSICYYSSNDAASFISNVKFSTSESRTFEAEIPSNAVYVRICCGNESAASYDGKEYVAPNIKLVKKGLTFDISPEVIGNILVELHPFNGKKFFAVGDSYTMYANNWYGSGKGYLYELVAKTGMQMVGNTAADGNGKPMTYFAGIMLTKSATIETADVLTVLGGTNDYNHGSATIGTFDGEDLSVQEIANGDRPTTIYGCVRAIVKVAESINPNIKVVFFTQPERGSFEGNPVNTTPPAANQNGLTMANIAEAIKDCCNKLGVVCFDTHSMLWTCSQCDRYTSDHLHPTEAASSYIGKLMARQMGTIIYL